MHHFDYNAVILDGDTILCVGCLPDGVDCDDDRVYPVFAGSEWDYYPTCDKCHEVHDYVCLTSEGEKNERCHNGWTCEWCDHHHYRDCHTCPCVDPDPGCHCDDFQRPISTRIWILNLMETFGELRYQSISPWEDKHAVYQFSCQARDWKDAWEKFRAQRLVTDGGPIKFDNQTWWVVTDE